MACLRLLGYLFLLRAVHHTLIIDLVELYSTSLSELNVELLLVLLRVCGMRLRSEEPMVLKRVLVKVSSAARVAANTDGTMTRLQFMLSEVSALQNNRKRRQNATLEPYVELAKRESWTLGMW